ncbi:hypothetical protein SETIT_9G511200v2 [Setaria italica]|uniref:dCMP deaminase n=1 Tax=Setaria italica TaxID=4555 RepID=A0A368SUQ4_SETIT|nr:hypothetical protein SETIT_9G511200v2 [Setaria italica]
MASTRDLVIASLSAAAGAAAAAAALRFMSSCTTSSVRPQNLSLATNGSAAQRPPKQSPFDPTKREGYISWDDYFMAIAFLSAERSKDPNRQVGACLVSQEGIILGIGYNGFPRGCSDDKLPWAKQLDRNYTSPCSHAMNVPRLSFSQAYLRSSTSSRKGLTTQLMFMSPLTSCYRWLVSRLESISRRWHIYRSSFRSHEAGTSERINDE